MDDLLETIIVDDGSTDHTSDVVKPFLSDNFKYIYQKNGGLSFARNTGIKASKGKIIQFLDADDMLGAQALSGRLRLLTKTSEYSIAVCRTRIFKKSKSQYARALFWKGWPTYTRHLDVHLCNFNIAPPHAFMLKKEVIDRIGMFDINLSACEDYDFWLRALFAGCKFIFCSKGIVFYRQHQASMSQNQYRQRTFDSILHQRLQSLLISNVEWKSRFEILMAFLAGVLCTINRFNELNKDPSNELIRLFQWVIHEIDKTKFHNTFSSYYYFMQTLLTLKYHHPSSSTTDDLKRTFLLSIEKIDDLSSEIKLFKSVVKYILSFQNADMLERYRLAKYYIRRII
jgi:glycosyltransferase involved in cell wall biosynthesis